MMQKHTSQFTWMKWLKAPFIIALITLGAGSAAWADVASFTCTTDPTAFAIPSGMAIITTIVNLIMCILYGAASGIQGCTGLSVGELLFRTITSSTSFIRALHAALTLYVIIYGICFMVGIIQITFMDFIMRLAKIAAVVLFTLPSNWSGFYFIAGQFFINGTNELISVFSSIALNQPVNTSGGPFAVVDSAIGNALSARMFITLVAMFFTGPYGLFFAILLAQSLGTFVSALFQAVWIYVMSLVIRAFLLGLAPIFICCLLFQKTRHLFDGWLNQLVSASLQPVFLFAFFAFFAKLVEAAIYNILKVPVCYVPNTGLFRGTPFDQVLPRFAIWMNGSWQPYSGDWGWQGAEQLPAGLASPVFPISILDMVIFLIIAQLAWRFNTVVLNIAKEIAGASTNLQMSGAFTDMLNPSKKFEKALSSATGGGKGMGGRGSSSVRQTAQQIVKDAASPGVGSRTNPK